jgi:hypothetical protein
MSSLIHSWSRSNETSLGVCIFSFSAIYFWYEKRRTSTVVDTGPYGGFYHRLPRNINDVRPTPLNDEHSHYVSSRGKQALTPVIPYLRGFLRCLNDTCDTILNRQGHVALCVAENKLVFDLLAERFMNAGAAVGAFTDSSVYCYSSFLGMPLAREAVAYFLAKRFLFGGDDNVNSNGVTSIQHQRANLTPEIALQHIKPHHIALAAGCAPLINHLFYLLGEPGECCIIPAPYYAAFENVKCYSFI